MTLLKIHRSAISIATAFILGIVTVSLATMPEVRHDVREMAWTTGILAGVAFLLSCYFQVEQGRHRSLLMLLAVATFCLTLPLLMGLMLAWK